MLLDTPHSGQNNKLHLHRWNYYKLKTITVYKTILQQNHHKWQQKQQVTLLDMINFQTFKLYEYIPSLPFAEFCCVSLSDQLILHYILAVSSPPAQESAGNQGHLLSSVPPIHIHPATSPPPS